MSETKRDDGGPAFPRQETLEFEGDCGMSLRDWFAGQALAGIMARPSQGDSTRDGHSHEVMRVARISTEIADALIAELLK